MADDVTRNDGSEDFLNFLGAERRRLALRFERTFGVLTSRAGFMTSTLFR
jgi:hypothetical protein